MRSAWPRCKHLLVCCPRLPLYTEGRAVDITCNCGSKTREYEYTAPDGTKTVVKTQHEAIALARKNGGTWRLKS